MKANYVDLTSGTGRENSTIGKTQPVIRGGSSFRETFHLLTAHKLTLSLATQTEEAWGRVHDAVGCEHVLQSRKKERKKEKKQRKEQIKKSTQKRKKQRKDKVKLKLEKESKKSNRDIKECEN